MLLYEGIRPVIVHFSLQIEKNAKFIYKRTANRENKQGYNSNLQENAVEAVKTYFYTIAPSVNTINVVCDL